MKIVLASSNRNKYREMKEAFRPIGVELIYGGDSDAPIEVDETGESYEENALLKARAWSEALGMAALADDSGLEVFALGGSPGVHSARAVPGSDADRTIWLLSKMESVEDRRARFVSCIAVEYHQSLAAAAVSVMIPYSYLTDMMPHFPNLEIR